MTRWHVEQNAAIAAVRVARRPALTQGGSDPRHSELKLTPSAFVTFNR
jgi:hypothetical protein